MKRACAGLLSRYLAAFPCVALFGPRQCGKTTLLSTLPKSWTAVDLEKRADFAAVSRDPDLFLRLHPERIAIDEAQICPDLFPALRVAIDADRKRKGRFVITGSSSPALLGSISETLAGRVGLVEMSPFSFAETEGRSKSAFFDALVGSGVRSAKQAWLSLTARSDLASIHRYWQRGGYPEPWLTRRAGFREDWTENYVRTYIERDISRLFPGLNRVKFSLFIELLANLSGSIINYADVGRALGVSQPTARDYFEIAAGTFLWRTLPAYEKNALKRVVKHPKGHLRDTGLLHHYLHLRDWPALRSHPQMGRSWEGMVIEELLRALEARGVGFTASHYRTGAGAEVDLVLEGHFGLLPVEVKYGQAVSTGDLRSLAGFVDERKLPLGLVINNDERPRAYTEKIVGVPFACL